MKSIHLILLVAVVISSSCQQKLTKTKGLNSDSFMPMQIGNSWKMGDQNYTEIQDTVRIGNKTYFKFYSLVGGDAVDIKYLRIDENNALLEAYPDQPGKIYTHAKFNSKINDEFFTLGDQSENDYKVKVTEKSENRMTFEFDMVHHPKLKGSTHQVTYIKGKGLDEKWQNITINNEIIK